jgi:hypothetical protein
LRKIKQAVCLWRLAARRELFISWGGEEQGTRGVIQNASASGVARVEVRRSGGRHFQISHSKTEYGPATSGTGSTAQRNGTGLGRESSWVSCPLTRVPLFG